MPGGKKRGKKKYKRKYKRRYGSSGFGTRVIRSPTPMRFPTKMIYVEQFTLDPGSGTLAGYVFSGNGLYDPNITGTGHQPRGFDQLMAMYDHYVVVGSKCNVKLAPSNQTPAICCLAVQDGTGVSSDINNYLEHRLSRYTSTGSDMSSRSLTIASSPRTYLGRSKVLSDPELKGTASANPTEGYYFVVATEATDNAGDPGVFSCVATIEYSVVFIEPKRMTQS